ncbi:MAG: hypothetical protein FJ083_00610 [Cyanobacteria bacterium K_Offshore_surface_m2_239]|nr:hypothetical protein [Cyanobacteria bacterium K_Offshore_surface_m2_239]
MDDPVRLDKLNRLVITGTIRLLGSFSPSAGTLPFASLTDGRGCVLSIDSGTIRLMDSFNGANGAHPSAALISVGSQLGRGALPPLGAGAGLNWSHRLRQRESRLRQVATSGRN